MKNIEIVQDDASRNADAVIEQLEGSGTTASSLLVQSLIAEGGWIQASTLAVRAKESNKPRAAQMLFAGLRDRLETLTKRQARVPRDHHKCPHTLSHHAGAGSERSP